MMPNVNHPTESATETVTITIQRVTDLGTEAILSFTDAPLIHAFYAQRGVALGVDQSTNAIAVRVLALELLKTAQYQQKIGLGSAAEIAEQARRVHAAAQQLNKGDTLICSFGVADTSLTL